jgi:DNA-binding transcriptional MerR regulator
MGYTVGDLAKLAHISVRALHHYDEIGLLAPSGRSQAGYRLYTDRDLERLQQVLFFRELGFALEDIRRILSDPGFDRKKALVAQRALLVEKAERFGAMVALVDKALDALKKGNIMDKNEMFEGLGEYEQEAKTRWGGSAEYTESARRTKRYTKEDWKTIRAEWDATLEGFAQALAAGVAPTDPHAMDAAERARLHIDRWFYPCSHEMHAALGGMYVTDARFADNYERKAAGLAQFVCDAIRANAARAR